MDGDLGCGVMRLSRDQPWWPPLLGAAAADLLLATTFEWGIALHGIHAAQNRAQTRGRRARSRAVVEKIALRRPGLPSFSGAEPHAVAPDHGANGAANVARNLWAYLVIFCGHFPDGAEKFTAAAVEEESKPDWYLRQMLGTANFKAGPLLAFTSGNLCFQIEHHLFPDLPSSRYAQIATKVRALCKKFALPYTTGSLLGQYL